MIMCCSCKFSAEKKIKNKKNDILILINNIKIYENNNDNNNEIIMMIWQINHTLYYQFIFFSDFMHIFSMLLEHWHSLQLNFSTFTEKKLFM